MPIKLLSTQLNPSRLRFPSASQFALGLRGWHACSVHVCGKRQMKKEIVTCPGVAVGSGFSVGPARTVPHPHPQVTDRTKCSETMKYEKKKTHPHPRLLTGQNAQRPWNMKKKKTHPHPQATNRTKCSETMKYEEEKKPHPHPQATNRTKCSETMKYEEKKPHPHPRLLTGQNAQRPWNMKKKKTHPHPQVTNRTKCSETMKYEEKKTTSTPSGY